MTFNPCIPTKKTLSPSHSVYHFFKLILKENFCIFPQMSTEISVLFHRFQIFRSSPNYLLSLLSLHLQILDWICTHSDLTQFQNYASQVRDQVISSSLISDPPVLAPISGASPSFSQPHLLLKFLWSLMCCYSLFCSDFRTKLFQFFKYFLGL